MPGIQDHCPVLLGIFIASWCPPQEPSDLQDIFFAASTNAGPILYHPVPKCKETLVKDIICAVFLSREQLWNFRSSRGHIWTKSVFKSHFCVCVCVWHTNICRATQRALFFREQSCPRALWLRDVFFISLRTGKRKISKKFLHCFCTVLSSSPHSNVL